MTRTSLSKQAADCLQRISELQTQIEYLSLDNRRKRAENRLLSSCCDALLWLRQQQLNSGDQRPTADAAEFDELVAALESGLDSHAAELYWCSGVQEAISHPTWASGYSVCTWPPSSSVGPPAHLFLPLAPPDDLLRVLYHLVYNPPDVQDMTLQQLHQSYISRIQEMGALMNVWNNPHGVKHSAQHPAQQLWDIIFGHWRLLYAVSMSPCPTGFPTASTFFWSNAVTGEVYMPDPQKDVCLHVIKQLQLTDEQQEQIAWGYSVLHNVVMGPLVHKLLQSEKDLGAAAVRSAASLFAAVSLPAGLHAPHSDQAQNKQHQQLDKEMRVITKKLALMEVLIACFVIGCMTLKQNCQLLLSSYPLVVGVARVATYISEQYQERQDRQAAERKQQLLQKQPTFVDSQDS